MWTFLRGSLWVVKITGSMEALFVEVIDILHGKLRSLTLFICAGALWTLWKTRNYDVVFDGKVLASPMAIIHKTILLVKSWKPSSTQTESS
jgi:hypothetical protein